MARNSAAAASHTYTHTRILFDVMGLWLIFVAKHANFVCISQLAVIKTMNSHVTSLRDWAIQKAGASLASTSYWDNATFSKWWRKLGISDRQRAVDQTYSIVASAGVCTVCYRISINLVLLDVNQIWFHILHCSHWMLGWSFSLLGKAFYSLLSFDLALVLFRPFGLHLGFTHCVCVCVLNCDIAYTVTGHEFECDDS